MVQKIAFNVTFRQMEQWGWGVVVLIITVLQHPHPLYRQMQPQIPAIDAHTHTHTPKIKSSSADISLHRDHKKGLGQQPKPPTAYPPQKENKMQAFRINMERWWAAMVPQCKGMLSRATLSPKSFRGLGNQHGIPWKYQSLAHQSHPVPPHH